MPQRYIRPQRQVLNPAGHKFSAQLGTLRDDVDALQALAGINNFFNRLNIPTTKPTNPNDGDIYFDKTVLALKIWLTDVDSGQWVQF